MNTSQFNSGSFIPPSFTSTNYQMTNSKQNTFGFFSMPNTFYAPLNTNSPSSQQCGSLNYKDTLVEQMPKLTETPMEEEECRFNDEVFDLEEDEEYSDDTTDSTDLLASQLLETVENIKKQSEKTNKILQTIVGLNTQK